MDVLAGVEQAMFQIQAAPSPGMVSCRTWSAPRRMPSALLTDARGTVVPHAGNLIQFSVGGPATLTAADNGRQENAYGYTVPSMPAFNGRALAVAGVTREPGTIRVTAAVGELLTATVTLASVPAGLVPGIPTGGALALPASIEVTYAGGPGRGWAPAANVKVSWATASNKATTITFDPVLTSAVRLTMTSPAPGTAGGFLAIAELGAVTG